MIEDHKRDTHKKTDELSLAPPEEAEEAEETGAEEVSIENSDDADDDTGVEAVLPPSARAKRGRGRGSAIVVSSTTRATRSSGARNSRKASPIVQTADEGSEVDEFDEDSRPRQTFDQGDPNEESDADQCAKVAPNPPSSTGSKARASSQNTGTSSVIPLSMSYVLPFVLQRIPTIQIPKSSSVDKPGPDGDTITSMFSNERLIACLVRTDWSYSSFLFWTRTSRTSLEASGSFSTLNITLLTTR